MTNKCEHEFWRDRNPNTCLNCGKTEKELIESSMTNDLKEKFLEEFTEEVDPGVRFSNTDDFEAIADWWLSEIKERDKRLVEEMTDLRIFYLESETGTEHAIHGRGFNEGLTKAQEIIKKNSL